ncbi:MAG: hypothetical protein WDO16_02220 [Bacteroidota bacterium]
MNVPSNVESGRRLIFTSILQLASVYVVQVASVGVIFTLVAG